MKIKSALFENYNNYNQNFRNYITNAAKDFFIPSRKFRRHFLFSFTESNFVIFYCRIRRICTLYATSVLVDVINRFAY